MTPVKNKVTVTNAKNAVIKITGIGEAEYCTLLFDLGNLFAERFSNLFPEFIFLNTYKRHLK